MRLFAALPLSEAAVERLTRLRLRLSAPEDALRWSEPEQWHITLQFYGTVAEETTQCLETELAGLDAGAPELALETLGLFAAKGILFAAVDPDASLLRLHEEVLERGKRCGIVPESRPFRPHITLARSKGKNGDRTLRQMCAPELPAFGPPIRWRASECLLLESILRPEGSQYVVRSRAALKGEA